MSLAISTAVVGLISLAGFLLRIAAQRALRRAPEAQHLLKELITASELCACSAELTIVADAYGLIVYSVYLCLMSTYQSVAWGSTYSTPYLFVEDWWRCRVSFFTALLGILAEVVGGWTYWRYMQVLWKLELSPMHSGRWLEACTSDLQVSPLEGALVEAVAVFLCRLLSRVVADEKPPFGVAIKSISSTALVIAGWNYTGGYYNPVLASALKFGCRGHTAWEHVLVYWAAATLGSVASIQAYLLLRPVVTGRPLKKE